MVGDTTDPTGPNNQGRRDETPPPTPLKGSQRLERWLGIYLLLLPVLLTVLLVAIWPSPFTPPGKSVAELRSLWNFTDQVEVRLLAIVLVAGALGSAVTAARSYANFHGFGRYDARWTWWYLMKVPIGMGLALFLYLVVRGGLFTASLAESSAVLETANPFGFAALGALAGMFAKEASDKLEEIFQSVFRTEPKPAVSPGPKIDRLEPARKRLNDPDRTLTVLGKGFDAGSVVKAGGRERASAFKDPGVLVVTLLPEDLARAGDLPVTVAGGAAGGTSAEVMLTVSA